MTTDDVLGFEIEVLAADATEEDLDKMTRNLLSELKETTTFNKKLIFIYE